MNGWINLFKPKGISSARAVSLIKQVVRPSKVGHAGTLDVEAEGVLPIGIGEATKLMQFLTYAQKEYRFTIQFGTTTDTKDASGQITATTEHIPTQEECFEVVHQFIGNITQIPPTFSALKINGVRAYTLARQNQPVIMKPRQIQIYSLVCTSYNLQARTAEYIVECSKGTYIRTLAEDIAFHLQSLGYVLELRRTKVGNFFELEALHVDELLATKKSKLKDLIFSHCLDIERILDDISVITIDSKCAIEIRQGQICQFYSDVPEGLVRVRYDNRLLAIGMLENKNFISARVFNL